MSRIFLIPGLGADYRIYKNIDFAGYEVTYVNWIEPDVKDTLETYAQTLIKQYDITEGSIVIGNSMGGMVAVEIAKKLKLQKVILISSIKTWDEAPSYFFMFRKIPVQKLVPGSVLSTSGYYFRRLFGKMSSEDAALFADMLEKTSPVFAKWAVDAILKWHNTVVPESLYHITGDKDLIFNYKRIHNTEIVKGGTHLMVLNKANEINKILKDILAK